MDMSMDLNGRPRLIVLIPESLAGNLELANRIAWMALRDKCEVLYLALVDRDEDMLSASMHMTTMKAVTAGKGLPIQTRLTQTRLWVRTLREIYRPGDRVVCHQEQLVKNGFLKTMPADEFLRDRLKIPTLTLSGIYHAQQELVGRWLRALIAWLGFLMILFGFTALEIQMDPQLQGASGKMLLGLIVLVETGAIWAWNSITG